MKAYGTRRHESWGDRGELNEHVLVYPESPQLHQRWFKVHSRYLGRLHLFKMKERSLASPLVTLPPVATVAPSPSTPPSAPRPNCLL